MLDEIEKLEQQLPLCLAKDRPRFQSWLQRCKQAAQKGNTKENSLLSLMEQVEKSCNLRTWRLQHIPEFRYPLPLPILEKKSEIISLIQQHPVIVVAGETGSGKTTQLPKMCIAAGLGREGKIGCTQPRRVAATSIARYLNTEVVGSPGAVSYKIRFDTNDSGSAFIKIMTDGILLAEIHEDPYLYEYDTLIIDEAHERSLNIDFILGYVKRLMAERKDLKIIISSATIDTESFSKFFEDAPIVEVSGRMYPVTVYYQPIDQEQEEIGEVTMIDAAIDSAKFIFEADNEGDMLIFMPGEADIRETVDRLSGASWCDAVVLPLFSRLTAQDQNRIFQNLGKRKVVVATNIAETSITIPGIRYVIDTGYARLKRYCPRTKTKRLPIEAIARSSADQRKGRCGRVQDGVCIRLYSQDDYEARERFTPPEIKRSDLAEVILRLAALEMGDIEIFPFLDAPSRTAIRDGIQTLIELGAMDSSKKLTDLGWEMAKIPTDPRTSRILLAAIQENALGEILPIASALSIQDPRERPFENVTKADECHRQFMNKDSDFLTYLKLWDHFHHTWSELKTQNKIRNFCHQNFLSYLRMREWCDLHDELCELLEDIGKLKFNTELASYEAIHKAILSGFLGHICCKKEKNIYYARENQELMIFPGSALFNDSSDWVVAAELVETSRLFARTVAKIDVSWIEPLAKHLMSYTYTDPRWNSRSGQANATEKGTLWGMVIVPQRPVHYGRTHPKEARELLIRHGLVRGETDARFPFLLHNQALIQKVLTIESKLRKREFLVEESQLEQFYQEHVPEIVTIRELQQHLDKTKSDYKLRMKLEQIISQPLPELSQTEYPDFLLLGNQRLNLRYCFAPDLPEDGVTMEVPLSLLHQLTPAPLTWLIPGWLEQKIEELLKCLPKDLRRRLMPLSERSHEIWQSLPRSHHSLLRSIEAWIYEKYHIRIEPEDWHLDDMPKHLFWRFEVLDFQGKMLGSGRDLELLQRQISANRPDPSWETARQKWFLPKLRNWCFDQLPESVEITPYQGGLLHLGYPGLEIQNGDIQRNLFHSLTEAEEKTQKATYLLLEYSLAPELAKLERMLATLTKLSQKFKQLGWSAYVEEESLACAKQAFIVVPDKLIRTEKQFQQHREMIRTQLWDWMDVWPKLLEDILTNYDAILDLIHDDPYIRAQGYIQETVQEVKKDLQDLFPRHFLLTIPWYALKHYPRYLKALQVRLNRTRTDPSRDRKKAQEIAVYFENFENAQLCFDQQGPQALLEEYRWMIEEFKVSLFAQELGTGYPISAKKLQQKWAEIEEYIVK